MPVAILHGGRGMKIKENGFEGGRKKIRDRLKERPIRVSLQDEKSKMSYIKLKITAIPYYLLTFNRKI